LLTVFFGRVAVVDEKFLPAEIVLPSLQEARSALAALNCAGSAEQVRSELVRELDRAIRMMTPIRLPLVHP
jgi:hypothetical protein